MAINSTNISITALVLLACFSIYCLIVPARGAWDGITDAIIRGGVIGFLSLVILIVSVISLKSGAGPKTYHVIMLILSIIPSLAFVIFAFMLLRKLS